jgi:hypothetical protein
MDQHFTRERESVFISAGEHFHGEPPDVPLWEVLQLRDADLKPFARDLFALEPTSEYVGEVRRLRDAVTAYMQFQDLQGVAVHPGDPLENRHYCYYQSLFYIRESIVSFLDQNALAAFALLRPFIELSVLHVYWLAKCEDTGYAKYYEWLRTGKRKPPFKNALDYCLRNLPASSHVDPERLSRLKATIEELFASACAYNHTPGLVESVLTLNRRVEGLSRDTFFFYLITARLFITQITYLYVLAYPMILFPIERIEKFGYQGPVGVFSEEQQLEYLQRLLGVSTVRGIQNSLHNIEFVKDMKTGLAALPTLTNEQIEASWQQRAENAACPEELSGNQRLAYCHAFDRSTKLALNNLYLGASPGHEIQDEHLPELDRFMFGW